jgi:hypothetical protein
MSGIKTRQDFKDYCLRRLGAPVIQINVDEQQVEDRVTDALEFYQEFHYDSLQKLYWIHHITDQDVANKYLDATQAVDPQGNPVHILGVTRIFPLTDSQATINMFDLRYQLRLNELYDFTSASYINYTLTQQHLRSLELQFTGEVPIRWARHMQRLYIDWAWGSGYEIAPGQVVVAECYATINPDQYPWVYNDRWLKRYATALIKKNWGENMKKYGGLQLPGGVTLNGKETYDEAVEEINQLEKEMIEGFDSPLEWFMN